MLRRSARHARKLLAGVLALLALLALPAAAQGEGWTKTPQVISPAAQNAFNPAIAMDPEQETFVGWSQNGTAQVAIRRPDGAVATTPLGSSNPFFDPPAVAADSRGTALATFLNPSNEIHGALRPPGGSFAPIAGPLSIPNVGFQHVAFTSGGTALLAFCRSSDGHVSVRIRPPGGSFPADGIQVYDGSAGPGTATDIATDATGDAIVAWATSNTTTATVWTALYTPAGFQTKQMAQQVPVSSGHTVTLQPHVAMDASGNAAVTTVDLDTDSTPPPGTVTKTSILASVRQKAAGTWAGTQQLDNATRSGFFGPGLSAPVVTYDSSGKAITAWLHGNGLDVPSTLRAAVSSGTLFGSTTVATVPGTASPPLLAPLKRGRTMLAFTDTGGLKFVLRTASGTFTAPATAFSSNQVPFLAGLAADSRGDIGAALGQADASMHSYVALLFYDATPPFVHTLTVPTTAKLGHPVTMSAGATDAFSRVSYLWAFGDGKTKNGAQVRHTYASRAGSFTVKVAAVDAAGNAGPVITRKIRVTAVRPVVRSFRVKPSRFAVGSGHGTRLRYSLNEPASVKITFARASRGKRFTRVGTLRRHGKSGKNSIRFSGRLGGEALKPGRYKATIVARVKGVAKASRKRSAKFRIVKR